MGDVIPEGQRWLFWDLDPTELDLAKHANYIIPRVLEKGRLVDVRWLLSCYGASRIHQFLAEVGHPELSARTLAFWRAFFEAKRETWKSPPSFRRSSSPPWHD